MKSNLVIRVLVTLGVTVGIGYAQGSGSTTAPPSAGNSTFDVPFQVTRIAQGKLIGIDKEKRIIAMEDRKGKRSDFQMTDKVRFKAKTIQVVYSPDDGKVIELKLVYVKKA